MTEQKLIQLNGESNFDQEVLKSEVPAVVDFYADWCGPCRVVGPTIESLSREYAGRARFAKVNVDENEGLASRYGVQSIPTVIIFGNGRPLERVVGVAQSQVYRERIDRALSAGAVGRRE